MSDGRVTESLPLSMTLITLVSVVTIGLDGGAPATSTGAGAAASLAGAARPPASASAGPATPEPARVKPESALELDGAALRHHAALLLILRLSDPALASRVEGLADPGAALAPSELARLRRILGRAGASADAFLRERVRLARSPARRAGLVALLDEWHAEAPGR